MFSLLACSKRNVEINLIKANESIDLNFIFCFDSIFLLGGICWSSISNGRCKELLSQGVTREDCCASNAAAATAYSEEDLDSGSLFFWRVLGGGVQCRPCRGTQQLFDNRLFLSRGIISPNISIRM